MTATKTLTLPDQFKTALALVERANAVTVIANKQEYDKASSDYRDLIQHEKELDLQYNALECVIQAKAAQVQKKDLAAQFDAAKKHLKNGAMRAFDDAQEAIRVAEQNRLAAIEQAKRDAETAALIAAQKAEAAKAEKERKAAEAIAAKTKDKAAKAKAIQDAADAAERAKAAKAEQEQIRKDAALAPAATVIVEKSHHGVTRKKVYKWRLTTKDRRQFVKDSMKDSDRLVIADLPALPSHLFALSRVLLNDFVDSQGEAAAIPGVLEVKFDLV